MLEGITIFIAFIIFSMAIREPDTSWENEMDKENRK